MIKRLSRIPLLNILETNDPESYVAKNREKMLSEALKKY